MAYEIRVPSLGESIVEATVARWLKRTGESVAAGEPVVELETDKVNLEVAADSAGIVTAILKEEGATVGIGDVLGIIETGVSAAPRASAASETPALSQTSLQEGNGAPAPATPTAQRVAAEYAVDLRTVTGTGPGGRITKEDVLRSVGARAAAEAPSAATITTPSPSSPRSSPPPSSPVRTAPPPPPPVAPPDGRREERQRLSRRRLTIARRLVEAQQTAAILTTFNEVDMSAVLDLRKRHRETFQQRHGVSLGLMSFFTKAVIGALKAFPIMNAEIQGDEVVIKYYYDIGIAVGMDEGLVVPVVRDADRKSFAQLEREIADLAQRAREGRLSLVELQGGTFTITNGGVYGSLMSTPILNAPQVGILGMHKIEERPVVVDGQIVIRPMMYVALSYDHRLIDGSTAVRFLVRVKELIEDPEALLLEG